eukprot:Skav200330  [mRNA]  locus=scaffold2835:14560:15474:+ [translate_table: standard]
MGDDKRKPFAKSFEILGAVVAFPKCGNSIVEVRNKDSRLVQLAEMTEQLKSRVNGRIPRHFLESYKGRMLYAAGHTYGRCTQMACQLLHKLSGASGMVHVSLELVHASVFAMELLSNSGPRMVRQWCWDSPVLVFTDGAAEDDFQAVTHGAVLVDPRDGTRLYFGDQVPEDFVKVWKRNGKRQVIAQAELFPVVVAKCTWKSRLSDRSVLWFLDNESARMALIRNYSPVLDNFCLLQMNAKQDVQARSRHWYSRVPSLSNPSDDASRLVFEAYRGCTWTVPQYEQLLKHLQDFRNLICSLELGR